MFGNKKHWFKKQKKGILNATRTKIKLTWHMTINQQHALEKNPKEFYGFKVKEELILEDNLRKHLKIVSDNIAEKLI